jgi:outer membrane protein insertion porin family
MRHEAAANAIADFVQRPLSLLLWCLLVITTARAQTYAFEGQRVAQIRIVDQSGLALPDKLPEVPLAAGKPFTMDSERATLRDLYRTGRYSDIRTQVTAGADGLRVDFVVQQNFFNNVVTVTGIKEPPTESAAISAIRLNLGEPFRESALKEGIDRLTATLHDEGLYQAEVTYALVPHADTHEMDVHVTIGPGPRARIGAVQLQNQSEFSNETLLKKARLSLGQTMLSDRIDRAAVRTRNFLVSQEYLGAAVSVHPGDYDAKTNRVTLLFDVTAGPKIRVEVNGANFSKSRLRTLLPIYAEGTVDDDLLQEGRRNLRDNLQRQGYFDAQVDFSSSETPDKNERLITYEISRGERHKLTAIAFAGNKYFNSELLESRLAIKKAAFGTRGLFSQNLVRDDTNSIHDLYTSNGFLDAKVSSEVDDNYKKAGDVFVRFRIQEGPQTRIGSLKIEGNSAINRDSLLAVIGSTQGQPYSEANVSSDRTNILALYFNDGFPDASCEAVASNASQPNRVDLVYKVTEGGQIEVARLILTGYEHVRRGVISRQVKIKTGGPLREGDVVDTQRGLYNLAIFDRVTIAPQNPSGSDPEKTVVVAVNEGDRYTLGYGFGFEAVPVGGTGTNPAATPIRFSPRGLFEVSDNDFMGRAQTLSFKVRASTLQYRGVLSFIAPNFLNDSKLSLQLTGFADKTLDVNTFTSTRYEGSFQIVDAVTSYTNLFFRYYYRHVIASDLKISAEEIPLFSQPTRVSGVGFTWSRDRRDNPADAARGTFNTLDFDINPSQMGSSANFMRFFFQNSSYHSFGQNLVFARATRIGIEEPFNGTTQDEIPLPERFFAGGDTSLRGFGLNQAGPRDLGTGFPIGGSALVAFNQELHFPLKLPRLGDRVGGTLLYDVGNVYTDLEHVNLRWSPPSPTDLNYLSHTVGFGFRYATPIGPVRLDFGYQLNPAQFQFTNPSTNQPEFETLPHFQFFFNIGPVF